MLRRHRLVERQFNQIVVNFRSGEVVHRGAMIESVIAGVQRRSVCYGGGAPWRDE